MNLESILYYRTKEGNLSITREEDNAVIRLDDKLITSFHLAELFEWMMAVMPKNDKSPAIARRGKIFFDGLQQLGK